MVKVELKSWFFLQRPLQWFILSAVHLLMSDRSALKYIQYKILFLLEYISLKKGTKGNLLKESSPKEY